MLSVYVQCRFKIRCKFFNGYLVENLLQRSVQRFGFKHRLRKVFGSSAAIFYVEGENGLQFVSILKVVMDVLKPKNIGSTLGDLFDFSALRAQIA